MSNFDYLENHEGETAVKFALICSLLVGLLFGTGVPVADAQADVAHHFGFKKSVGGQLPSINEEGFKDIIDKHGAIFFGDPSRKELFLTFDNGYENGYTALILDTLKAKKVPAIFFVTGHYIKDQPELLKRMVAEGHLIGNHSWSHPDMATISDAQIREELEKVKQATAQVTGQAKMDFLRPPRGIFSDRTLRVTKELGYTNVFWSVAYKDWDVNDQRGADYAYQKVVSQLHPGAVILLHSVSKDNAAALGAIIDEARRQGYEFKSLYELKPGQSRPSL
ncbi:delta-lactam-biosynthetic de-N-acetylase [Paenibacillus sp. MB22_1]|uniref:delta-lactam-biosynthetic de-N-acetylase n=1 Tax=Paenibacillus sp. MB22_1 TaxID=3383121 RepID=UPI0039A3C282